jgi:excisionase family DNA binding protein
MLLPSSPTSLPSSGLQERLALHMAEAAEMLGVSQWLVLQQVGRGAIPHTRVGRRILFPRTVFLAWLESTDHEPSHRPEVPLRLAAGHRR